MDWLLDLVNSPDKRAALSWLGAGIVMVASGIWAVIKFYSGRGKSDATSTPINQKVVAKNGGVAAGRDAHVGIKGSLVAILLLLVVALMLLALSTFGRNILKMISGSTTNIPTLSVSLSCGHQGSQFVHEIDEEEAKTLLHMVDFAEQHNGDVVYLSVLIDQECAACGCSRARDAKNESLRSSESFGRGSLYIEPRDLEVRRALAGKSWQLMLVEGLALQAFVPSEWAVGHMIFLPRYKHMSSSQYRTGSYGTFASFSGLFTARYEGATGGNTVWFDVLQPSEEQLRFLECMRNGKSMGLWRRIELGCGSASEPTGSENASAQQGAQADSGPHPL